MRRALVSAVLAFFLEACVPFGLVRVGDSESDLRRSMGAPAMEFDLPDGTRQLVFPTGPLGTQTFMVYLGNGTVQRSEQVLTDDVFYRLQNGVTTREQVRRTIGPPFRTVRFENLKQDAWDYLFRDSWGYLAVFSVMIDDRGVVANKVTARIESGRDGGMSR